MSLHHHIIDLIIGSLYGMAIGDSIGAPLEFLSILDHQNHNYNLNSNSYKKSK